MKPVLVCIIFRLTHLNWRNRYYNMLFRSIRTLFKSLDWKVKILNSLRVNKSIIIGSQRTRERIRVRAFMRMPTYQIRK